ncbi:hypothetical protein C8A05DRAFT_16561 [Staphylotrichum tortipilum]|uniref:Uncharacterized protein n=1 Tax=Staphylotrichum tortipilum TaxID=2831512 RepID=A0AAN6MI10_9PEZI|nr:hypothetical protein C8A05DRAFT_16561 [Staphylotrichum longicolle]
MSAPSTTFATLPELLRCLAEEIHSRRQLATLCLISKTFNAAVAPVLHRELTIGSDAQLCAALGQFRHLSHVRVLSISDGSGLGDDLFHEMMPELLAKLPRLEMSTVSKLHESCPAIKTIHVTFPEDMGERVGYNDLVQPEGWRMRERALYGTPDLAVFSSLEELTLENLYEELPWWRAQIVQVLKNSPSLRKLKLSLSTKTMARYHHDEESGKFYGFFDKLCEDYGDAETTPLRLRFLHLGIGVYLFDAHCLAALTDRNFLEEVHVENEGVWEDGQIVEMYNEDDEPNSGLAFDAFGPRHCPNLRRINFAHYQRDVHAFLASIDDPSWTRRLAVSCRGLWAGYEPAALLRPDPNFPSLPLHLRMLDIDLQRNQVRLLDEDCDDLVQEDIPTAKDVLADLVSGDDGTLKGLAVHLAENLDADGGFEDFGLLVHALGGLVNLTQLAIEANVDDECLLKGDALDKAAYLLATAVLQLRYVKVYEKCWRVWRDGVAVRLRELEAREKDYIELFQGFIWEPMQCA